MVEYTLDELMELIGIINTQLDKPIKVKTAMKLIELSEVIKKSIDDMQKKYFSFVDKYAEKNEDGSIKTSEDKTQVILKKETTKECEEEMNKLHAEKICMNAPKFTTKELDSLGFTFKELILFSKLLEK